MPALKDVVWFSEVDKEDISLAGGKGANLGEMTKAGFPVPNGFIVTAKAYKDFIKQNDLQVKINHLLGTVDFNNQDSLSQVSSHIKKQIMQGELSRDLVLDIYNHYKKLGGFLREALVAVRSSATAEDLPNASFAGQQETFLNIKGEANLIHNIKEAWASLFEARAIFYRHENRFDHFKVAIAIPVQEMVQSEKSGVMFTVDPLTNDKKKIVIEAVYGLGEMIVQGKETPDRYEIDKEDISILEKKTAQQLKKLVKRGTVDKEISLSRKEGSKQKISDSEIKDLARLGKKLEHHYFFPQDVEWAIEKGKIYIVQTRPITTMKTGKTEKEKDSVLPLLLKGDGGSPGLASGPVRVLKKATDVGKILTGEVLVAEETNPDYVPAMKKAAAIVTDHGGRTSHAAIVSRELGIPAVVGTKDATKVLKDGQVVTVSGSKGEVYKGGSLSFANNIARQVYEDIKTATKVYVNLAEPEFAEKTISMKPDGVGLLRAEFMMAKIGVHPKKMIKDGRKKEFIEKLSDGIFTFCKTFNPSPVVYRTSDFKTNEYRNLIGGKEFEPVEPNPMLGYRGAFRYIHDASVFELELEAIKNVRNKKGFKNLNIMIPFVRNVNELEEVIKLISISGLHRSSSFKLWMMVEIPSNVVLLEDFIKVGIDGISIGTNDLTMLMLGTDRDNDEVASEYSETDPAVLWALEKIIKTASEHGITSSICGQAGSNPLILDKVIPWGITSVSVSPDAIQATRRTISEIERSIIMKKDVKN
ncbi:MAG: phosphoenolpyruvate synthase [Candidatus Levybacteria bacterium RIFOXYA1_FULL_41_10]|nr:MAG: Phosphoenolpyruvate synthase [Candidatus Levybacteria bacterium GW2011_GWA1_39_34]KKR50838.1 MAG: Phosphoenolpyruvate synthase [Candidatus Levybacteria bacterium GW2011_GWC1_40_19]KKR72002.1 MAG: Phosphoenolpyruvate synthase [Candidatus Levybacteria bacterium GW2011_GWC2_40_7]KKR95259.1 MAG: Phosphoenolpyruvate synthase [Candidatus Levybacteria bacterium GW2011_GWA2_41_15]KKS01785.1 MAG: Phosphoenolpyruvate synthase [Candidatus Levybacteria bacterium GW2011_GWB1_41_21]OGH20368.1 MAG: p